MKTLQELDILASGLLQKLPELMQTGTVYASDLMARFIKYIIVLNTIEVIASFLLIIIHAIVAVKWWKYAREQDAKKTGAYHSSDYTGAFIITNVVFSMSVYIFLFINLGQSISDLIQINYVPELFIINYFR